MHVTRVVKKKILSLFRWNIWAVLIVTTDKVITSLKKQTEWVMCTVLYTYPGVQTVLFLAELLTDGLCLYR